VALSMSYMAGGNPSFPMTRDFDITTKDPKSTKFGEIIIRNLRVLCGLRGENSFSFHLGSIALAILVIVSALLLPSWPRDSFGAAAPITIRVGYPQPSGAQLPLWVMSEAKLDRKYGFDLQNIYISGGARLTQTLVAGDIDMATTGGAVVNAVLSGADLVYIALIVPTYGFSVYARPDVKDISSLKGKVVGVMTKGASADHGMIAVLRHNHLAAGQDVKFLYLGGVREALAALERGIVSASVLSAPTTLLARRMGFKEVVNIATLNLPYVHNGLVTRRALTRQQPERIKAFLRAYLAAVKISNEDAEISKRALGRFLATTDAGVIDEAYQTFKGIFPRLPYFTEENIRAVLSVADHPKAAAADPKEFFDNRFIKELEESGFVKELYGQR
jgi:ABC-type nitrate/sulfonate/bicarbonate transport system substrate-binding protein